MPIAEEPSREEGSRSLRFAGHMTPMPSLLAQSNTAGGWLAAVSVVAAQENSVLVALQSRPESQ